MLDALGDVEAIVSDSTGGVFYLQLLTRSNVTRRYADAVFRDLFFNIYQLRCTALWVECVYSRVSLLAE